MSNYVWIASGIGEPDRIFSDEMTLQEVVRAVTRGDSTLEEIIKECRDNDVEFEVQDTYLWVDDDISVEMKRIEYVV